LEAKCGTDSVSALSLICIEGTRGLYGASLTLSICIGVAARFEMVLSVKDHEMRHRGQMMLIERMVGIVPHLTREMEARFAAATAIK